MVTRKQERDSRAEASARVRASRATRILDTISETSERAIIKAGKETLDDLRRSVARYSRYVQQILDDTLAGSRKQPQLADVLHVGDDLRKALIDAGLDDTANRLYKRLKSVRDIAADSFRAFNKKKTIAGLDSKTLNALAELKRADFLDIADRKLVAPVRTAIIDGIIGNRDRDSIYSEIKSVIQTLGITTRAGTTFTDTQIETLVDDAFRRQLRQAKAYQAEEFDMQIVWFQGPDDGRTSKQCQLMVRYAEHGVPGMWLVEEFTADNINKMLKADLIKGNPLIQGGHFNCRHSINYIPYNFAVEKGWTTPKLEEKNAVADSYE